MYPMTSAASESPMQQTHAPESNNTGGLIGQRSGGTHVSIEKWESEQVEIAERCKPRDDPAILRAHALRDSA